MAVILYLLIPCCVTVLWICLARNPQWLTVYKDVYHIIVPVPRNIPVAEACYTPAGEVIRESQHERVMRSVVVADANDVVSLGTTAFTSASTCEQEDRRLADPMASSVTMISATEIRGVAVAVPRTVDPIRVILHILGWGALVRRQHVDTLHEIAQRIHVVRTDSTMTESTRDNPRIMPDSNLENL